MKTYLTPCAQPDLSKDKTQNLQAWLTGGPSSDSPYDLGRLLADCASNPIKVRSVSVISLAALINVHRRKERLRAERGA